MMSAASDRQARELAGYFATPVAYVFIVIFLVLTGVFTFYLGSFYERGKADLEPFFRFPPLAVPVPGAGHLHAPVGRGTSLRHH